MRDSLGMANIIIIINYYYYLFCILIRDIKLLFLFIYFFILWVLIKLYC